MTTYTPSQLVNVQWKPCTRCLGIPPLKILMVDKESYVCPNCLGHGKEPVEMENPEISCEHCIDEDQDHTECCKDVECPECDWGTKDGDICLTCDGQGGVMICGKCKSKPIYKYQVGVEFSLMYCIEDCGLIDESHTAYCSKHHRSLHTISKFLPLRPKVEGDDSILLVTKVNYNEK